MPEAAGLVAVTGRARRVAAGLAERRRTGTRIECRKKPSQTLSPRPCGADLVHPVVPVAGADERQALRAGRQRRVDRARRVAEERVDLGRDGGLEVGLPLALGERRALEIRRLLVPHARVARRLDVAQGRPRQPEQVVRAARARAAPRRLVPPVLHVALAELARRGPHEMLAREVGTDEDERRDVLQLVAEARTRRPAGSSPSGPRGATR